MGRLTKCLLLQGDYVTFSSGCVEGFRASLAPDSFLLCWDLPKNPQTIDDQMYCAVREKLSVRTYRTQIAAQKVCQVGKCRFACDVMYTQ